MKTIRVLVLLVAMLPSFAVIAQESNEEPNRLVLAREAYYRSVQRALLPVNRDYLRILEAMKKQYGIAGSTEDMVAVQKEIDAVTENMEGGTQAEAEAEKMLVGKWNMLHLSDGYRDTLTFNDDHTMRAGNRDHGTWKVKNGKLRATFVAGAYFEALLPVKAKMTVSHSVSGGWTLEKQK